MTTENKAPKPTEKDLEAARKLILSEESDGHVYCVKRKEYCSFAESIAQALAAQRLETLKSGVVQNLRRSLIEVVDDIPRINSKQQYRGLIEDFDALIEKLEGK